ncbi:FtsX-like permease family protein [bacterium]|nr:FtsX-like permease family protein [bacterium]
MFKYALQIIFRRKLRTFLTSLGITIAIVLLGFIIFGMGDLQKLFVNEFNSQFQPNQVIVSRFGLNSILPSADDSEKNEEIKKAIFNTKVINEIRARDDVKSLEPQVLVSGMQMRLKGSKKVYGQPFISGWDATRDNPYFVSVTSEQDKPGKGEVFVSTFFLDFYNKSVEEVIGKTVFIESSNASIFTTRSKSNFNKSFKYKITGVFNPGQDRNDAMLNTKEALNLLVDIGGYKNSSEYLNEIGYDQLMITVNQDEIENFKTDFENRYGYKPISSDEILGFLGNITQGLTVALAMFGLVSAIVASIGIINTMIMSIYEQTKEIGIIKAIGASNFQVLVIFLIQSASIGLIGGLLGLGIVYIGMKVADPYIVAELGKAGFTLTRYFTFDPKIASVIIGCSIFVGVVAGIYPASRAARLDPVKALRYE